MKAKKCWQCDGVFAQKEIIIKNDWAYCPLCGDCLFDIRIQGEDHWIFTLPKVIKKYKEGHKYNE